MVNEVIQAQTSTFHPLTKHQWKDKITGQQVRILYFCATEYPFEQRFKFSVFFMLAYRCYTFSLPMCKEDSNIIKGKRYWRWNLRSRSNIETRVGGWINQHSRTTCIIYNQEHFCVDSRQWQKVFFFEVVLESIGGCSACDQW
jgi:hypothetical protein